MWWVAAVALLLAVATCGICCARVRDTGRALVWMQVSGTFGTLLLVVLAVALGRSILFTVPLTFALTTFVGVLAFLRLERGVR